MKDLSATTSMFRVREVNRVHTMEESFNSRKRLTLGWLPTRLIRDNYGVSLCLLGVYLAL